MEPTISQKVWDPSLEKPLIEAWKSEKVYEFDPKRKAYTIDTPPPYPSGQPWHVGAAAHYAQIDMISRVARMSGKNVYFPIGIDRNGLPVEMYTEKKHNIRMADVTREQFIDLCVKSLDDLELEMVQILASLGVSADIKNHYRTDSKEYRTLTQSTFIDLWHRDLIYIATRPTNYDWVTGTSVADAELVHNEIETDLVHMKFSIDDKFIIIASTRPELLCVCKAIIVNPNDERYTKLIGKKANVPIFGNSVKIIAHPSAKMEFGSGAVMVCSYGDQNDVSLFRELELGEIVSIGLDGRMTKAAGVYANLRPKQARIKIIKDLADANIIEKTEKIMHRVPVSERSKNPIEIIPLEEYYLKQLESVPHVRDISKNVKFYPKTHRQILDNWLDAISIDWPISRRRYYGTEIPIWRCESCAHTHVPNPGKYYRPWKESGPWESCTKCGGKLAGEKRIFDTWMDSSVSPLFISRYGNDEEFFANTYPASLRPQAKDIVRTWLYYTLLRCDQLTKKIPWSEAWVMGYGLDSHGTKMSKSKGNVIDPLPLIKKVGADTFRFWCACEVNHGQDFRCDEGKIVSTKKSLSKLWNVARLVSKFPIKESAKKSDFATDIWILDELDSLIIRCLEGYKVYNFFVPAVALREFTKNVFAAHYIEMTKVRAYGDGFTDEEQEKAISTMHHVMKILLLLYAPITPFIADHLWRTLYSSNSIHCELFPEAQESKDTSEITRAITEFNSMIWNEKNTKSLSLRDKIKKDIPTNLVAFSKDLISMHNLEQ